MGYRVGIGIFKMGVGEKSCTDRAGLGGSWTWPEGRCASVYPASTSQRELLSQSLWRKEMKQCELRGQQKGKGGEMEGR